MALHEIDGIAGRRTPATRGDAAPGSSVPHGRLRSARRARGADRAGRSALDAERRRLPACAPASPTALRCDAGGDGSSPGMPRRRARRRARARGGRGVVERAERLGGARRRARRGMEFGFLFDAERQLFSIGFNVADRRLDSSLLRPARLGGAAGELRGDRAGPVPQRALVPARPPLADADRHARALLSWSGSMFEYLMPLLVMRELSGTRCSTRRYRGGRRAADRTTAAQRGVPWGISESALQRAGPRTELPVPRVRRAGARAQARAGRRPGRRALRDRAGADGRPRGACANLRAPARATGSPGRYGFYEAIDYTPARLPRGQRRGVDRAARTWRTTRA